MNINEILETDKQFDVQHAETWFGSITTGNIMRIYDLLKGKPHTRKYDNTGRNVETIDTSISYILNPGTENGRDEQHAIWHFVRCITDCGHGNVPVTETSNSLRKALDTEIGYCRELGVSKQAISAYERAMNEFMDVAYFVQTPFLTNEEFAAKLEAKAKAFIDARYALSFAADEKDDPKPATKEEIESIVRPIETKQDVALASLCDTNKIVKRIDNRAKNAQRKRKCLYTDDQLNAIHNLWLKAQLDPNVKSSSAHKASLEAAVMYYKKEFNALGVCSANDLRKALKSWSKRFK